MRNMTVIFVMWPGLIDACEEGRIAVKAHTATVKLRNYNRF